MYKRKYFISFTHHILDIANPTCHGNAVVTLNREIVNEDDIEALEEMISNDIERVEKEDGEFIGKRTVTIINFILLKESTFGSLEKLDGEIDNWNIEMNSFDDDEEEEEEDEEEDNGNED